MRIAADTVVQRLRSAERALDTYKRKMHKLRRIVAGDASPVLDDVGAAMDDAADMRRPFRSEFGDVLVTDIEEGRSNGLLKALKTLVLSVAYYFPRIEFEGLEPEIAALNEAYCAARMKAPPWGCGARDEVRLALMEYAIGGMGWLYTPMRQGKPTIAYADTMDVLWDQTARLPQHVRWAAVTAVETIGYWVEVFGATAFSGYLGDADRGPTMDTPFELTFYYDLQGAKGNYVVLIRTGDGAWDEKPVAQGDNPCTFEVDGELVPFLPFESMHFLALPSVRLPIGVAEGMLPAQIALWRAERTIRDIVERGAGFYEVDTSIVEKEEIQKFEDGETGGFIMKKKGGEAITQKPPMIIPPALVQWARANAEEMMEQSGANPFAAGDRVEGVEYAAQVHAIQGNAGLTSGAMAKDLADLWARVVPKFLAKGKRYDHRPVVVHLDGEELLFDDADPIRDYLRPDAIAVVREETMQFRPRQERINEAMAKLQIARQNMDVAPGGVRIAFEELLTAMGEKNIGKWTAAPPGALPAVPAMASQALPGGPAALPA